MPPIEYQELPDDNSDSMNLFDDKVGLLHSQSTSDLPSKEQRLSIAGHDDGEEGGDHRRRRSATALELGEDVTSILTDSLSNFRNSSRMLLMGDTSHNSIGYSNNKQRRSFPVNEPRSKQQQRRSGRKNAKGDSISPVAERRRRRHRSRSTSNSRDRSTSTTRSSQSRTTNNSRVPGRGRTRSSSVGHKQHRRSSSKNAFGKKASSSSKSPKRSSQKENEGGGKAVRKPSLGRNRSGPARLEDSSSNLNAEDVVVAEDNIDNNNEDEPNDDDNNDNNDADPEKQTSSRRSSTDKKKGGDRTKRGRSRKQRGSLPSNSTGSGKRREERRKSRSTSTVNKAPPEASASSSTIRKSKNTALHIFDKSAGSEEDLFGQDDDTRRIVKEAGYLEASEYISNSRSQSLSRKAKDEKRASSLMTRKKDNPNNESFNTLRSSSLSRSDKFQTSSSTLRSGASTLRSGSLSRNDKYQSSSSTVRSASMSRKEKDKNQTSSSTIRSASLSVTRKRKDKREDDDDGEEDGFKVLRSASLSRPKDASDYTSSNSNQKDSNKKSSNRASSLMNRKRDSKSKKDGDAINNSSKSTIHSGSSSKKKEKKKNKKLYFPRNEPRERPRRRRSFTESSTIHDEEASARSDDRSVGKKQTILDILASPTTSRPKLSLQMVQQQQQQSQEEQHEVHHRVPSQPHPEHLKRKPRTSTGTSSSNNKSESKPRGSSKTRRRSRAQSKTDTPMPTPSVLMSPSALPNLLAPPSDDEDDDGRGDSHRNLLENISISDLVSPVKSTSILERIAKDAALALTDRWHTVPVITPDNGTTSNVTPDISIDTFSVILPSEEETPVVRNSGTEREAGRRKSRRERKEKTTTTTKEGGESRPTKRRSERSPRRRKKEEALMSKSDNHIHHSMRRQSSNVRRRQSASRSRSRSNSRSLSRSARIKTRNSLVAPEEHNFHHRRATSIYQPKFDNDDTGGDTDVSDRMEHEIEAVPEAAEAEAEPAAAKSGKKRTSILTMRSLYGGGLVDTPAAADAVDEKEDGAEKAGRDKRAVSMSPMRTSQRNLPVDEDLDAVQHGGGGSKQLKSVSETGHRLRTTSTGRASRRHLNSSGALDTEAVKRDGRSRVAKERKSRHSSSSDFEASSEFHKSEMELSHESSSTLNTFNSRGSNGKSGSNHVQTQRRRRTNVAKEMLHKSITAIPDLEPMPEGPLTSSLHQSSSSSKLDSAQSEQVWQRRRRKSLGKDDM